MAYYAYKSVRDLTPDRYMSDAHFQANYYRDYDGAAGYDGDQWIAAADYIIDLHKEIRRLSELLGISPNPSLIES